MNEDTAKQVIEALWFNGEIETVKTVVWLDQNIWAAIVMNGDGAIFLVLLADVGNDEYQLRSVQKI
jgi:hypothetical protein